MSLAPILYVLVIYRSGRLHAGAKSKGEVLPSVYPLLTGNDDAGNNAESQLREDKPEPVNALVEHAD